MNRRDTARLLFSLAVVVSACGSAAPHATIPARLVPSPLVAPSQAPEQVLKLRLYAGADFRARLLDWDKEAHTNVEEASRILQATTGVALELAEVIEWKRSGGAMEQTLSSLRLLDPGAGVDLVIGFIDAPDTHSDSLSDLRAYDLLGRHLLVRSFNRQSELAALGQSARELPESTQDELIATRRQHKQAVVLANTIAHLLGGVDGEAEYADSGVYLPAQSQLSAASAAIVRRTVAAYKNNSQEEWQKLGDELQAAAADAGLIAAARARGKALGSAVKDQVAAESILRPVDRDKLQEARNLLKSRKPMEAWTRIEALLDLYPEALELAVPACLAAQMRSADDAIRYCRHATELAPESAPAWIALALSLQQGNAPEVRETLDRAAALLDKAQPAQELDAESWPSLARAYQKLSLPRAAQRAASHSGPATVRRWVSESQLRYGSSVGVTEAREAAYLEAVKTGLKYVYASDTARAKASAKTIASDFPESIGASLIACEIGLRARSYKEAAAACTQVLGRQSDNSWAHYLLGLVHGRQEQHAEAIASLERAIEIDPDLKAAYQTLAAIYGKLHDSRLVELKQRYKTLFQAELK